MAAYSAYVIAGTATGIVLGPARGQRWVPDRDDAVSQHSAHDRKWARLRARKLKANPCASTMVATGPVVTVDHIKPQSTHPELRYARASRDSATGILQGLAECMISLSC